MASRSMVPGLGWDMGHTVYMDHGEDHDNIHRKYLARGNSTYKGHDSLSLPLKQQDMRWGQARGQIMNGLGGHHENCGCYLECDRKPRAGFKGRNHTWLAPLLLFPISVNLLIHHVGLATNFRVIPDSSLCLLLAVLEWNAALITSHHLIPARWAKAMYHLDCSKAVLLPPLVLIPLGNFLCIPRTATYTH